MISGNSIVKRYRYNKNDNKKKDWAILPKETEEDKFLAINNILINHNDLMKSQFFDDDLMKLRNSNQIAEINFNMQNRKLDKNTVFGIPVRELINPKNANGRCHGCVLALSMCIDNFTWVYGNLTNKAMSIIENSAKRGDEDILSAFFKETRNYDEVTPVFNHSYMIIKGKELLEQDIVNPQSFELGFEVDTGKEYVIDPRYNSILKLEDYNRIMQPEYFKTITNSQLKKTECWSTLYNQRQILPYDYNLKNFIDFYLPSYKIPDNDNEKFLSSVISTDISCMMITNQKLSQIVYEFKNYFLTQINDEIEESINNPTI